MIQNRALTVLRLRRVALTRSCSRNCQKLPRRFSSASHGPTPDSSTGQSIAAPIASFTNELDKIAPRFSIAADAIEILESPKAFYETLKTKISQAQRRVYLSTLYIGKTEHELIHTIRDALKTNPQLKVSILTDALRGTREAPEPSCASLLVPLVSEFGSERVQICMYHTPNLTGVRKSMLPKRINEGWGLQHMKLYGVDDEIIMSGANLSEDYFTNRQDRYHLFKSKQITDYFAEIHDTVCRLSFRVMPEDTGRAGFALIWPETNAQPDPLSDPKKFIESATRTLAPLVKAKSEDSAAANDSDTTVYPLMQLTPLLKPDASTELPALVTVLRRLGSTELTGSRWTFTAGYFNMTPEVRALLLQSNPKSGTVVAASPWANGFYGSKGISGMLPAAYTLLSRRFLEAVARQGMSDQIKVKEWRRGTVNTPDGWTYHAKGIWITLPGEQSPSISLIGSSNYTKRSYSLDLEANTLIVTRNKDLQRRLGQEESFLQEWAKPMKRDDYTTSERRVGLQVRIAMWIVTLVGGAL